jgi:glyoxylase-like metal-dependent hydrolase (beta-lactamase superfamily II)
VRLHPLLCGRVSRPPALVHREEGRLAGVRARGVRLPRSEWLEIPVVAFLVEHPGAGAILIDTGFHPSVAVDPAHAYGARARLVNKDVEMLPEQAVGEQLRDRGLDPAEVGTVVMTHLHAGHASGIAEFPDATFVVSSDEWRAAAKRTGTEGYVRRQFDHAFDWRTLDFGSSAADSFATFGRSFDLFGDGSVRMLFTPGHTAGHCSVVLRLGGREALLTADAAFTRRTLGESHLPHVMADEHLFRRSLREIQRYIEHTPDALVIPGHDLEAWRELDALYE